MLTCVLTRRCRALAAGSALATERRKRLVPWPLGALRLSVRAALSVAVHPYPPVQAAAVAREAPSPRPAQLNPLYREVLARQEALEKVLEKLHRDLQRSRQEQQKAARTTHALLRQLLELGVQRLSNKKLRQLLLLSVKEE